MHAATTAAGGGTPAQPGSQTLQVMQEIRGLLGELKSLTLTVIEAVRAKKDLTTHITQLKQITQGEQTMQQTPTTTHSRIEPAKPPMLNAEGLIARLCELFDQVKDIDKDGKKVQDLTLAELKQRLDANPAIARMIINEFYNNNWDKIMEFR